MKLFSYSIFAFWLLAVLVGYLFKLDPNAIDLNLILQGPDLKHWFGADDLGRDILARVLSGVQKM